MGEAGGGRRPICFSKFVFCVVRVCGLWFVVCGCDCGLWLRFVVMVVALWLLRCDVMRCDVYDMYDVYDVRCTMYDVTRENRNRNKE